MSLEHEGTSRYRAYALRMWSVNAGAWRFSLVDAETGQKRGFPDLAGLVAFLEGEIREQRTHTEGLEPKAGAKSAPVSPTG